MEKDGMNIQWYPGHMTKTRRMIAEQMKHMDAVCEILDARVPLSSRNPDVEAQAAPMLEAAEVLGTLLKLQEEPIMLLALIGKELRKLHTARIALDTGRDKFWLMERWNMRSDYPARLLLDNAKKVSREWCANGVKRCYEVDLRMKSVNGVDGAAELKFLLMELAQGAAK